MSQLDTRHGEILRTIDPVVLGGRVRSARIARGWSQGELAGDEFSVGYLSRIETGSRRPTMKVLVTIAERLGTTPEELLDGASAAELDEIRLGLSYAELALQNGEALDAEHQARQYVERAESASLVDLAHQGRFVTARAMEALGQLDEAITEFEKLFKESTGLAAVRCGIALSRCYREVGDLNLAVEVGERLQPTLESHGLGQTDEAIQLAMTVAAAYIERGDLSRAARICTETIKVAEEAASPAARSSAYWNASIVYSERGDTESALALANRALALLGEGQDARNLARLRLELGRLHMELQPVDIRGAVEQLEHGKEALRATGATAAELAQGDVLLARALIMDGRPEEALDVVTGARNASPDGAPLGAAEAAMVHGEALAELGNLAEARAAFHQAAEHLTGIDGADRYVAQTWCELAGMFEAVDEFDAARQALKHAAKASGLRMRARETTRARADAALD